MSSICETAISQSQYAAVVSILSALTILVHTNISNQEFTHFIYLQKYLVVFIILK